VPIDASLLLDIMTQAALEAGRVSHSYYRGSIAVSYKADASPVTEADEASEAVILERLAAATPDLPIVAEERVARGEVPATGRRFWLVDPLDGTKEFLHGRGDFTVNIALIEDGLPRLGVVYAPARSEIYIGDVSASRAARAVQPPGSHDPPAFESVRARQVPASGMTAVASRSHATPETTEYLTSHDVRQTVSVGSSLKFCLLACGDADLYPRFGPTMEWDTAAGHAVLVAAGGSVLTTDGAPLRYGKPDFRNPWFVAVGDKA